LEKSRVVVVVRWFIARPLLAAAFVGTVAVLGQFLTNSEASWGNRLGSSSAVATFAYIACRFRPS
jgi:hypothetical protein